MNAGTLLSVDQYLNTSYDPDVEYVEGVLMERNAGDYLHSLIQSNIIFALRRKYPNIKVLPDRAPRKPDSVFPMSAYCWRRRAPATWPRPPLWRLRSSPKTTE
jgi:hypothetical protein